MSWLDPDPKKREAADAKAAASGADRNASIALRLLLAHVQFLGAVQVFKAGGTAAFRSAFGWTTTVSASPFSLGPVQCVLQLPFIVRFLAIATLPITGPAALAAAYALLAAMRLLRCRRASRATLIGLQTPCCGLLVDSAGWLAAMRAWVAARRHISAAVTVTSLAYMPVVAACLSALRCTDAAIDGERYLLSDLSVTCYTGQHTVACAIAVIVLGVVGLGFPLALAVRLWRVGPAQLGNAAFRAL